MKRGMKMIVDIPTTKTFTGKIENIDICCECPFLAVYPPDGKHIMCTLFQETIEDKRCIWCEREYPDGANIVIVIQKPDTDTE